MLSLQFFLRKGLSVGYVGLNYNLKDLSLNEYGKPDPCVGMAWADIVILVYGYRSPWSLGNVALFNCFLLRSQAF